MNNIIGFIFKHNSDDLEVWTGFTLTPEEEKTLSGILENHINDGCSIRGTRHEIIKEYI